MDEDQLNDLKQFIADTVSQTEIRLTGRIDGLETRVGGLEQRLASLEHEVRDGFAGIGEVIEQLNQRLDDRDKEIDQHFTTLEGQIAT